MRKRAALALAVAAITLSGALYGLLRTRERFVDAARVPNGTGGLAASLVPALPAEEPGRGVPSRPARTSLGVQASEVTPPVFQAPSAPTDPVGGFRYDGEMAALLSTFVGEEPDLLGWTDYFARLASEAELDPTTLRSSDDQVGGTLRVPGTDIAMDFTLDEGTYTIAMKRRTDLTTVGPIAFRSSLSGSFEGDDLGAAYGSVQVYPSSEQRFYETHPIGYLYEMRDGSTSFCPLTAEFEGGHFAVSVPAREDYSEFTYGNLQLPYELLLRLRALRPSGD